MAVSPKGNVWKNKRAATFKQHTLGFPIGICKLFGETKLLSDMLQSQTVDLARAVDLIHALVQTLKDHRQEESFFDKLWDKALDICEQCDSAITSVAKRQRTLSSRLSGYCTLMA